MNGREEEKWSANGWSEEWEGADGVFWEELFEENREFLRGK